MLQAPKAKQHQHFLDNHGHKRLDEFYWLRDDERKNPEILNYLKEENEYTEEVLSATGSLREDLFNEIKGRIKEKDLSVPYFEDGYWYYVRFEEGQEYPVYCRKKETLDAPEEILLDVNLEAKSYEYYSIGQIDVSDDGKWIAFSEDIVGRRQYRIRFKSLENNEVIGHILDQANGDLCWAADNQHIFYTVYDKKTLRGFQIYRYCPFNDEAHQLVYTEEDESFYTGVSRSKSKAFITINLSSTTTTEVQLIPADQVFQPPIPFIERQRGHEYAVYHYSGSFFIISNLDNAKNFKLLQVDEEKHQDSKAWKEVIPHREDTLLEGLTVFDQYLVLEERQEGLLKLRVMARDGSQDYHIPFSDSAYTAYSGINLDFAAETYRLSYSSLRQPYQILEFKFSDQSKKVLKEQEVIGGYEAEKYLSERIWALGEDGVKIPISIVYPKTYKKDGSQPLYTYAYGSYGLNVDPVFSSTRLSLLDRGFAFAIFHVRGGEDLGRKWYETGRQMQKWNTFRDYVACTKHLNRLGFGTPANTFATGGSAGGLLMGVLANEASHLYKGIVAQVPFVDVVTTMLDPSIPLTTNEYDEWGNPENETFYDYILSYSPYDNIREGEYTNLFISSGLHDSQVQYWEPTKWCAKLRAKKTDDNLLLLYTNMDAGHGGASGRFERFKEVAMEYAFILNLLK